MPVTNSALLSQIHLSGESGCPLFSPHMLKANFCTVCSKLINKHSPQAIPDDQCLLKVGELINKSMVITIKWFHLLSSGSGVLAERGKNSKLHSVVIRGCGRALSWWLQRGYELRFPQERKGYSHSEHRQGIGNIWTQISGMKCVMLI